MASYHLYPELVNKVCLKKGELGAHIRLLSSTVTPGNDASSNILPSKNSMI